MIQAIHTDQLPTQARDPKMQKAAQEFVKSFFAQTINLMLQNNGEENYEREMYTSFLSEAMGEKIAAHGASSPMVTQIYRHMAGQKAQVSQPIITQEPTEVSHDIL